MYRNANSVLEFSSHSQNVVVLEDGETRGDVEGTDDGDTDGDIDGIEDGFSEGESDGEVLGTTEGDCVGSMTHLPHVITQTSKARNISSNETSLLHISAILSASMLANHEHLFGATPIITPFSFLYS